MTNEVSPVTESEMSAFFSRLSTMIVSASEQAAELRRVQDDVGRLNERIVDLVEQNDKLKREVAETWQLVQSVERERDEAKAQIERLQSDLSNANERHAADRRDYEDRLSAAHDALAQRDQRIAELEQAHSIVVKDRDGAAARASKAEQYSQHLESDVAYWRDRYIKTDTAREQAESHASSWQAKHGEVSERLAQVQAKLTEATSLFAAKVEPVTTAEPPVPVNW